MSSTRAWYPKQPGSAPPRAGSFAAALADAIADPAIKRLPSIRAADQFIDSTDALDDLSSARAVITACEGIPG